jgi:predicted membrane-bound spermidine synthase
MRHSIWVPQLGISLPALIFGLIFLVAAMLRILVG